MRRIALAAVAGARFDDGNYFFVIRYDGFNIAHANAKLIGTDMSPRYHPSRPRMPVARLGGRVPASGRPLQ